MQWAESRLKAFPKPLCWYNWSGSSRVHRVPAFKQACCIASTCKFLLYFFTFFFGALQLFYSVRSRILSYVIGPRFIKMRVGSHSRTRVPLCTIFRLFRGACAKTGASGKSALCVSQYHNMPLACQIPPTEATCRCFCPLPINVDSL